MPTFYARPYAGIQDQPRLRAFLVDFRAAQGHGCWHTGDLTWRCFLQSFEFSLEDTLRIWEDPHGQVAGFAVYDHRGFSGGDPARLRIDMQVHPHARGQGLEARMLEWLAAQLPPTGGILITDPGVYEDDTSQIEQLQQHGFHHLPEQDGLLLVREVTSGLTAPVLPPGYHLRPVTAPQEAEPRAALHRAAFESRRVTAQRYLHLMQSPDYHAALDTVAVSPSGELAAFALGWYDSANRVGEFEPVGTHPDYRRKGLAQAVLLAGMAALQHMGARQVVIGPIPASELPALHTYLSLGFQPALKTLTFARSLQT